MRRLFSDWSRGEHAWIVAPLALWLAAFIVRGIVMMIRQKRVLGRGAVARQLGWPWKASFVAAVTWLVGWAVWLAASGE